MWIDDVLQKLDKTKYQEVKRLAEDRKTWRKMTHQPSYKEDGNWWCNNHLTDLNQCTNFRLPTYKINATVRIRQILKVKIRTLTSFVTSLTDTHTTRAKHMNHVCIKTFAILMLSCTHYLPRRTLHDFCRRYVSEKGHSESLAGESPEPDCIHTECWPHNANKFHHNCWKTLTDIWMYTYSMDRIGRIILGHLEEEMTQYLL